MKFSTLFTFRSVSCVFKVDARITKGKEKKSAVYVTRKTQASQMQYWRVISLRAFYRIEKLRDDVVPIQIKPRSRVRAYATSRFNVNFLRMRYFARPR